MPVTEGEKVVSMYVAIAFLQRNISPSVSFADSSLIRRSHIVRRTFPKPHYDEGGGTACP